MRPATSSVLLPPSYLPLGEKVSEEAVHGLLKVKVSCKGKRTKCKSFPLGRSSREAAPSLAEKLFGYFTQPDPAWDRGPGGRRGASVPAHSWLPSSPTRAAGTPFEGQLPSTWLHPSVRPKSPLVAEESWLWIRLFWDTQWGSSPGPFRLRFLHLALGSSCSSRPSCIFYL